MQSSANQRALPPRNSATARAPCRTEPLDILSNPTSRAFPRFRRTHRTPNDNNTLRQEAFFSDCGLHGHHPRHDPARHQEVVSGPALQDEV